MKKIFKNMCNKIIKILKYRIKFPKLKEKYGSNLSMCFVKNNYNKNKIFDLYIFKIFTKILC